jgi:hypothetical protein
MFDDLDSQLARIELGANLEWSETCHADGVVYL